MRSRLSFKATSVIVVFFLWSCALSRQNVGPSEEPTATQAGVSSYLSPRSKSYYNFLKSRQHLYLNRLDEAIADLEKATSADPDSSYLFLELASFYLRQGRNAEAIAAAERAKSLDPGSIKARMLLAGLYGTMKQPDRAIAEYKAVLELEPKQHKALLVWIYWIMLFQNQWKLLLERI